MRDVRIELRFRNNLILSRMEEFGIKTVSELCRLAKVSNQAKMGSLINMRISPFAFDSDLGNVKWLPMVVSISKALCSEPEELFPEAIQELRVDPKTKQYIEISSQDLKKLGGEVPRQLIAHTNPELEMQALELSEAIEAALETLTPREQKIIRLRFGFEDGLEKTVEEVGGFFAVTVERVRQIEAKALRKLRHRSRSEPIKKALNYPFRKGLLI